MARIGIIKFVPANIQLSKNQFHQVPWSRVPHPPPRAPSACLRSVAAAVQGSVSAEADGKCPCRSVVCNALRKCQFVVDISKKLEEKNTFRSSPTFNDLSQNSLFCPPQHPSPACGMWCVPSGWLTFPLSTCKNSMPP